MLNQTSELAIRMLIFIALRNDSSPISPRRIALKLDLSPTYMEKVARLLVRAGILRAHRGARGGLTLSQAPEAITLLAIVEACQGVILGAFCQDHQDLAQVCGYHCAMAKVHDSIIRILSDCTLSDLAATPCPVPAIEDAVKCRLGQRSRLEEALGASVQREEGKAE